jgi:hypothetical protein
MLGPEYVDEILESTTPRGKKRRHSKVNSIIVHTTGFGPGLDRINTRNKGNLKAIGADYAKRMAGILKYKGHFLIDHTGKIWQFLPLQEIAWHSSSGKKKLLLSESPFTWWAERWGEQYANPTELPSWKLGNLNLSTVGIDLLAHGNGTITKGYTKAQYKSLAKLATALADKLEIELKRDTILGHEDVDPLSRGTSKGGWDPGAFDWGRFFSLLEGEEEEKVEKPKYDVISYILSLFGFKR